MRSTDAMESPGLQRRSVLAGLAAVPVLEPNVARAATAAELDRDGVAALSRLYGQNEKARQLSQKAIAILIFPKITKGGLMIGGQGGEGVLRQRNKSIGYYKIYAASFGLQAGFQTFSYALFFITQSALDYLRRSEGWAVGSGPSFVVADEGYAKTMNTTTLSQDVYAMPFGQHGLMGGLGMEGSKITPFTPKG